MLASSSDPRWLLANRCSSVNNAIMDPVTNAHQTSAPGMRAHARSNQATAASRPASATTVVSMTAASSLPRSHGPAL